MPAEEELTPVQMAINGLKVRAFEHRQRVRGEFVSVGFPLTSSRVRIGICLGCGVALVVIDGIHLVALIFVV